MSAFPDPVRANWAVANAKETSRLRLTPALRRAYSPGVDGVPDRKAMEEARDEAQRIAGTLQAGLDLLEDEES